MSTNDNAQKMKPEDFFWQTYLDGSKAEDEARPKNWEGSTTGILTFTGLFAATVAAFIVESYQLLSVDSGDQTVVLLSQLLAATANASSNTPVIITPNEAFSAPPSAIITNALWFSSLLIALICALLSTLVQEWARNYVQDINRRSYLGESLEERAYNHIYIRMGVNRYGMDRFVSWIVALVHLSVFLFACGLLVFLFPINHVVATISTVILGSFIAIYCVASLIPLLDKSCPYRTPVSYMMAFIHWLVLRGQSIVLQPKSRPGNFLGTHTIQHLIPRHYPTKWWNFLTDLRFQFAWEHTYIHINIYNQSAFFLSLRSLILSQASPPENCEVMLRRLRANSDFMRALSGFMQRSRLLPEKSEASTSPVDPDIFEMLALLPEGMYSLEVGNRYKDDLEGSVITSPWLNQVIGYVSLIAEVDGPSQLSANLCLAHVLRSLLQLCRETFEKSIPTLSELEDSEVSSVFEETQRHYFPGRMGYCNSNAILLFTTGSYQPHSGEWTYAATSSLVPLHDGDCCRDWRNDLTPDGLAHVAACNALTVISHVLESTDSQRNRLNSFIGRVLGAFGIFDDWDAFRVPQNDKNMPSPEFVSVLRSAGLDEWLEPGSDFYTGPRDGPEYKFLRDYPGESCVNILRQLARYVNFEAYFERARLRQRTFPLPYNVADTSMHASPLPFQSSSSDEVEDRPQRSPNEQNAFLTVAQNPLDSPSSPAPADGTQARAPVSPSHVADSLPAPETSSAVDMIYGDVRGTSREGESADATGESLSSSSNAPVTIPTTPNGNSYNGILSTGQDRATDTATVDGVSAEAQHEARVADAVEEAAATSTALGVYGREQEPINSPESPVLRSVRVDDDRRPREGIVQDGVEMTVVASVRCSSSGGVAESDQERAV